MDKQNDHVHPLPKKTLTLCMTNTVVKEFTADVLLTINANPIMGDCLEDISCFLHQVKGILLNMGGITRERFALMHEIALEGMQKDIPIVLDPVGCHSSSFRMLLAKDLLATKAITCLKGNHSEIYALYEVYLGDGVSKPSMLGVNGEPVDHLEDYAKALALHLGIIVVATGPIDIITNGDAVFLNRSGHAMMTKITGTGCVLGAILASRGSAHIEDYYDWVHQYGRCGEEAFTMVGSKTGSYKVALLDALSIMNERC